MAYLPRARQVCGKATVAQVNAGLVIVPDCPGRTLRVTGGSLRAIGGTASGATSVDIVDNSAVNVLSVGYATLVSGTLIEAAAATLGAGWNADLTPGNGLTLTKTGSALATATHIEYVVTFVRS